MSEAAEQLREMGYELGDPVRITSDQHYKQTQGSMGVKAYREAVSDGYTVFVVAAIGPEGRVACDMKASDELVEDEGWDEQEWLRRDGAQSLAYAVQRKRGEMAAA